jgi:hypothetical protein
MEAKAALGVCARHTAVTREFQHAEPSLAYVFVRPLILDQRR